jgi:hypothetical protein
MIRTAYVALDRRPALDDAEPTSIAATAVAGRHVANTRRQFRLRMTT